MRNEFIDGGLRGRHIRDPHPYAPVPRDTDPGGARPKTLSPEGTPYASTGIDRSSTF
ncbi:hypothetical protein GCM10010275_71610 [Streptomyces litmocidini]|uniref:hypothetical protein n=1 Tax=Streptomyces litmocidini TaxID=67318 RepID=UPI00167C5211|nr:hypothetical protein [Streptomyces litmocidini]GGV19541.1 hypothetical protein GCM10010275_71610 [Streptomyces litmocidini]